MPLANDPTWAKEEEERKKRLEYLESQKRVPNFKEYAAKIRQWNEGQKGNRGEFRSFARTGIANFFREFFGMTDGFNKAFKQRDAEVKKLKQKDPMAQDLAWAIGTGFDEKKKRKR